MKTVNLVLAALALAAMLSACANTSSRISRDDHFSGLSVSMPIGGAIGK